jgi:hypothetical protein
VLDKKLEFKEIAENNSSSLQHLRSLFYHFRVLRAIGVSSEFWYKRVRGCG